jgi:hypothetical protein
VTPRTLARVRRIDRETGQVPGPALGSAPGGGEKLVRTSILLALLAPLVCGGCFVLDEIDKSSAEFERHSTGSASRSHDAGGPARESGAEERPARSAVSRWWEEARTLVPGEGDGDLVRCRLGRDERFMRSADCRSLGGVAGG